MRMIWLLISLISALLSALYFMKMTIAINNSFVNLDDSKGMISDTSVTNSAKWEKDDTVEKENIYSSRKKRRHLKYGVSLKKLLFRME